MNASIKRIYEPSGGDDGFRVLVDRLWPRGVSKERARVDLWLKEVAPSGELRKWFDHDPAKWDEFKKRYREELKHNPEPLRELRETARRQGRITLLYGAKDETHNQAVALLEILKK